MVKRRRPDLRVGLLRGNVNTRLRRIEEGAFDGTLLAMAGLNRLGLAHHVTAVLEPDEFLPAVGQGAIAVVARAGDARVLDALAAIVCGETGAALAAERAFLAVMDGSCRTPIAGHARLVDGTLSLRGLVLRPDGSESLDAAEQGPACDAERIGEAAGRALRERMPEGFLQGGLERAHGPVGA
jgi:hydroxymethylbilane synthase